LQNARDSDTIKGNMNGIEDAAIYALLFVSLYFEVFLLFTFLENRGRLKFQEREKENPAGGFPSATIIVPCWNEENTVEATVESLLNLDYPKDKLKIFVVDDGSADGTWGKIQRFKGDDQIKIFHKENGGKHTAVNLGIENAETEFVGCLDADSFVDPKALKRIMRYFEDPETMAVTPALKVYKSGNLVEMIQNMEYKMSIFMRKMFSFLDALQVTPGPFSIFRKKVFNELGPYKHAYNTEDLEYALRMQSKHYKIENAHDAFVYTVAPATFKGLYRQRVRWITGFLKNAVDYRFMFLKKEYGNLGILILPLAFVSVFSALFFVGRIALTTAAYAVEKISLLSAVNFDFGFALSGLNFDWFFVNTGAVWMLSVFVLIMTAVFIAFGKKMADGKFTLSRDFFYYLFLYGLIAPFWLIKSIYNLFFAKKALWR